MKRFYDFVIKEHLRNYQQMIFLSGPRQVGKTTLAKDIKKEYEDFFYFNWDILADREKILLGQTEIGHIARLDAIKNDHTVIVFDEIHKYKLWKTFIKGFFDQYKEKCKIIVTGSSSLDTYNKGGDSMMGRYFLYHIFPITVGELVENNNYPEQITFPPKQIKQSDFDTLLKHGGFPEPFLHNDSMFSGRWKGLRNKQLFREDIQSLSNIQEVDQLEVLAKILQAQVGQIVNRSTLSQKIRVSVSTISRWLNTLQTLYYCFEIKPWSRNVKRSLVKEPKIFLYDWSLVQDVGAKFENFVALHLYKFVLFQNDTGRGDYGLYFVRDKDKKEVDFLVVKDGQPWLLVEVKASANAPVSKSLYYYAQELMVPHTFQVVFDMEYVDKDCFKYKEPIIVPAQTFLSQLV
ncbi:MAG: ATP-binding protein [Alphaproteobacteria bacterium]|nr:ATP-binding protein [Alphaproteobacteria bacterium]OJV46466.1 MAG: hypothetical protein BGO28_02675 [Alphaproteobacteria bacterium 43-37]